MDITQSKIDLQSYKDVHYLLFPSHKDNANNKLYNGHKIIDCFHCKNISEWENYLKDK